MPAFEDHIDRSGHDNHDDKLFVEGYAPITVGGEAVQIYYKIAGDLITSKRTPLVVLHGGPGLSSLIYYPHSDLLTDYDIPVILYDQVGGGESTHLPNQPQGFWSIDLFCDELEQLLKYFGIEDNYDLLGHSWGGMLATYFLENRVARGLRHLVLVGSPSSAKLLDECTSELIKGFPEKLRASVEKKQRGEEYDEADLDEAGKVYFTRHVCQLESMPTEITETMMTKKADPTVNEAL